MNIYCGECMFLSSIEKDEVYICKRYSKELMSDKGCLNLKRLKECIEFQEESTNQEINIDSIINTLFKDYDKTKMRGSGKPPIG